MIENGNVRERLDSWKSICAYLERDVSTLLRWEKEKGLPIHRIPGGQRQAVYAFRDELDAWLAKPDNSHGAEQYSAGGNGSNGVAQGITASVQHEVPSRYPNPAAGSTPRVKRVLYSGVGVLAAMLLLIAVYLYVNSHRSFHVAQLILQQQLTSNSQEKQGLLTNGKTLYFGQEQNGWYALAAMPVEGGPIRVLWSPQANVLPEDLTPDGRKLLALVSVGIERDRELWVVPLDSGEPRRLAKVTVHSAVWAPDGRTIAYASGNEIYFTSEGETAPRKIGSFTSLPNVLAWSQDGQRLRFVLVDNATDKVQSWGEISGDDKQTITLRPLPPSMKAYGNWTWAAGWDGYLITGHEKEIGRAHV